MATTIKITAKHVGKTISMECASMTINQQFDPTWATEQAYGKMDPIATFSHTGRTVQFKFKVAGEEAPQQIKLQSDVDQLIKFQYPRYTGTPAGGLGSSLAAPPFFDITVLDGKLYNTMSGYIHTLNIEPGTSTGIKAHNYTTGWFEAQYIISFTMTVLHAHVVGYVDDEEPGGDRGFIFTSATEAARKKAQGGTSSPTVTNLSTVGAAQGATADTPVAAIKESLTPPVQTQTSVEP
jgi:hypothetical protein